MSWSMNLQETDKVTLPAGKKLSITLATGSTGLARSGTTTTTLTVGTTTFGAYSLDTTWYIDCLTGTITYDTVDQTADEILNNSGVSTGGVDLRGVYDASVNTFPATGGSGVSGAILKGDTWKISVGGTLGSVVVEAGDVITALIDTPAQTAGNWFVTEKNMGYTPENAANKVTSISGASTDTQYPSGKLVYDQLALKEATANKDATGGYAGLTLFKINFKNAADTFINFLTNATTAARTWTFQDKDGTIADLVDVATKLDHVGRVGGTDAAAGDVGEYVEAVVATGSAVSLTSTVVSNVTSISLTAGDWDIEGIVDVNFGGVTATDIVAGISPTTGALGAQDTYAKSTLALTGHTDTYGYITPKVRVKPTVTTTYYLVSSSTFTVGTAAVFGTIRARRSA